MEWDMQMYNQVRAIARKHNFTTSMVKGNSENMADLIVHVDDESMIGLKINPPLSVKPLTLFPYGKPLGIDELDEFFEGCKMGSDLYNA